jgi:hypothetical protein
MEEEGSRSAQFKVSAVAREDNVGFPDALLMTTYTSLSASCTMGTRSFPAVKSDRAVTLTPHPLLVPWS